MPDLFLRKIVDKITLQNPILEPIRVTTPAQDKDIIFFFLVKTLYAYYNASV
jgi:hypothetical protein